VATSTHAVNVVAGERKATALNSLDTSSGRLNQARPRGVDAVLELFVKSHFGERSEEAGNCQQTLQLATILTADLFLPLSLDS
jgi:hypothetical protein